MKEVKRQILNASYIPVLKDGILRRVRIKAEFLTRGISMGSECSSATRRTEAIAKWLEAVFALYPLETSGFIQNQKDRFANPVGYTARRAANVLYDAVIGADVEQDTINDALSDFIRVRAVQDLRPDQAVGAIFLLKPILREFFLVDMLAAGNFEGYLEMESRVDTLALMGFNLYVLDRETIYAERVAEQRRSTLQLKRWAEGRQSHQPKDRNWKKP